MSPLCKYLSVTAQPTNLKLYKWTREQGGKVLMRSITTLRWPLWKGRMWCRRPYSLLSLSVHFSCWRAEGSWEAGRWSAVITLIKNDDKYGSGKQALQARQLQGHCQLQLKGKMNCHQRKCLLLCQAPTFSFMLGKWSIAAGSLWICASRNF